MWRVSYAIITAIIGFMLLWRIFGLKENAHFAKRNRGAVLASTQQMRLLGSVAFTLMLITTSQGPETWPSRAIYQMETSLVHGQVSHHESFMSFNQNNLLHCNDVFHSSCMGSARTLHFE